jgi:hypothetical protein
MDKLAGTLTATGHPISADTVSKELEKLGFSRQFNPPFQFRNATSGHKRHGRASGG